MVIDTVTIRLLTSVLSSPSTRRLFTSIADSRLATAETLANTEPEPNLNTSLKELVAADLIGVVGQQKYYVTAKGLKVARYLEKL